MPMTTDGGRSSRVELVEVGPRDGLQSVAALLAPSKRAELVKRLAQTGLARIEAVSFVDPARVPQMAGAEDVVASLDPAYVGRCSGLVLNERGLHRLLSTRLSEVRVAFAVSDEFNRRNSNQPTDISRRVAREIVRRAKEADLRTVIILATAFGCPFAGEVDAEKTLALAADVADAEPDEIIFADTIGVAVPRQIRHVLQEGAKLGPIIGVHLHNTRNTGYANAYAALEAGATVLDASIGGLGGCPFAPGASGNIATEDLVYFLEREGISTGCDLDALIATGAWLSETVGVRPEGLIHRVPRFPPHRRG